MTLARRVCAGCERTLGFALWRWSGSPFLTTHGLCAGCLSRMQTAAPARRFSPLSLRARC